MTPPSPCESIDATRHPSWLRRGRAASSFGPLLLVGALIAACGISQEERTPSSPKSPTQVLPTGQATARPEDVVAWQHFRDTFGLRSDEAWVRAVADEPTSTIEFGVPLLPWEIARIAALNLAHRELIPILEDYGRLFPDEYAGTFIDGPVAVIQFRDHVTERRAALATLLGSKSSVDVRQVRYSLMDLTGFARRLEADGEWLSSVGVDLISALPRVQDNKVELIFKANEDLERQIASRFGNPDWLALTREGPLPWAGGYGRLVIRIVDRSGKGVEAGVVPTSMDPRVSASFLPREVTGLYEEVRLEAIVWNVIVTYFDGDDEKSTSVIVRVPDGGVGTATVVVDR